MIRTSSRILAQNVITGLDLRAKVQKVRHAFRTLVLDGI